MSYAGHSLSLLRDALVVFYIVWADWAYEKKKKEEELKLNTSNKIIIVYIVFG